MKDYLFVAEAGLNCIQAWSTGSDQVQAKKAFWASLTDEEQNATESVECIDERPSQPLVRRTHPMKLAERIQEALNLQN